MTAKQTEKPPWCRPPRSLRIGHGARRALLALLLVVLGLGFAYGQVAPPLAEPPQQMESEAETIARCLRDLRSKDVETRRRAAMIIGKYQVPEAQAAVITCLRDPDAAVRRTALVSLTEEGQLLEAAARLEVFRLLSDPDVHIRRIASSMLGELSIGMRRGLLQLQMSPTQAMDDAAKKRLAAESLEAQWTARVLNDALVDEDASVRRNVLLAAQYYPGMFEPARLEAFFTDPSVEMRVLALRAYGGLPGPEEPRLAALEPLLNDDDPRVREELARNAARLGAVGTGILRKLAQDPVLAVRVEAVRLYAAQQDPAALPLLMASIRDDAVPLAQRLSLLQTLSVFPNEAGPLYDALLEEGPAALRAVAMRMLATGRFAGAKERSVGFYIDCLDADSDVVVQAAATVLQQRQRDLTAAALQQLLQKRNPEARKLALRCTATLSTEEAAELLMDACLDESVPVRQQALQLLVARQIAGWRELLLASLEDSNPAIRQTAAEGLMRAVREPAVRDALTSYLERCSDPHLKLRLERLLATRLPPLPVPPTQQQRVPVPTPAARPRPLRPRPQPQGPLVPDP